MNKTNQIAHNKYNKLIHIIFFSVIFLKESMAIEQKHSDETSTQWENRSDVQDAVKNIKEAHRLLEDVVQGIYNVYVPYTIGEGEMMRDRMKSLNRLINVLKQFQWIKFYYTTLIGSKVSYDEKMKEIKQAIHFHYFMSELSTFNAEGHNIVSEIGFALDALTKDPKFIEVTQITSEKVNNLKKTLYLSIRNAVETIPDGTNILKNKD